MPMTPESGVLQAIMYQLVESGVKATDPLAIGPKLTPAQLHEPR
jgi:hypothetical protein